MNDVYLNPVARLLGRSAAILMVLGLLTGGLVSSAMTGMIRASVQSAVAALSLARVAAGGCPPAAPTDPDVQNSRIRLFGTRIRYAVE